MDKPIRVECTDGTVFIHSPFQIGLNWVKAQKGRKWNPGDKTWSIPMTTEMLVVSCPFDCTWKTRESINGKEATADQMIEALNKELRGKLESAGLLPKAINFFEKYIPEWYTQDGISVLERQGRLAKANEEQVEALYHIEMWYSCEMERIEDQMNEEEGNW